MERIKKIKALELAAQKNNQAQIFIETPYRNNAMMADILQHAEANTLLCIAADITLSTELIQTKKISDWKKNVPDLNKRPSVFLIG
jgi:16S rRNA (cytidine1402-2'-O)-methyltransferase